LQLDIEDILLLSGNSLYYYHLKGREEGCLLIMLDIEFFQVSYPIHSPHTVVWGCC